MRYCRRCVQPDTRPGIVFDAEGVCPACRFAEEDRSTDWAARRAELEEICAFARARNVSGYDCIVGVSGGKDSTRQAVFIKEEMGLNPLLVCCSYPPEQLAERGARNLANLVSLGFDCLTVSPAPGTWKRLMREGFRRFGNWCKSTEMALYASAPKTAIAYQIPVVFLGENPAITAGALEVGSTTGDASRMKYCHTLSGGTRALMPEGMSEEELFWYQYCSDDEMELARLRIVYMGYYIPGFTKLGNAEFSMARGLEVRNDPPGDIGDLTGHEALDEDFVVVNQMLKHLKFGFGKVTEQVSEEIRLGRLTRQQGVELVRAYDGACAPRYIEAFCRYLKISEAEFWEVAERFRNKDIWRKGPDGAWSLAVSLEAAP